MIKIRNEKRYLYTHNGKELEVWANNENEALETISQFGFTNPSLSKLQIVQPSPSDIVPIE